MTVKTIEASRYFDFIDSNLTRTKEIVRDIMEHGKVAYQWEKYNGLFTQQMNHFRERIHFILNEYMEKNSLEKYRKGNKIIDSIRSKLRVVLDTVPVTSNEVIRLSNLLDLAHISKHPEEEIYIAGKTYRDFLKAFVRLVELLSKQTCPSSLQAQLTESHQVYLYDDEDGVPLLTVIRKTKAHKNIEKPKPPKTSRKVKRVSSSAKKNIEKPKEQKTVKRDKKESEGISNEEEQALNEIKLLIESKYYSKANDVIQSVLKLNKHNAIANELLVKVKKLMELQLLEAHKKGRIEKLELEINKMKEYYKLNENTLKKINKEKDYLRIISEKEFEIQKLKS